MKCPNCGAEVNGKFCEFCGTKMPEEATTLNIVNNYYGNTSGNAVQQPSSAFCPQCGGNSISFQRESSGTRGYHKTVGMCKTCGYTWVTAQDQPTFTGYISTTSPHNKGVALILCIFFGVLGGHYFYVGRAGMGILYLFTAGLFGIGWIIDIVRIAAGSFKDSYGLPLV